MGNRTFEDLTEMQEVKQASKTFAAPSKENISPSMQKRYEEAKLHERIAVSILRFMDEQVMGITYTPYNSAVIAKRNSKKAIGLIVIGLFGFLMPEMHIKPMAVSPVFKEIRQKSEQINQDFGCIFPELVSKPVIIAHTFTKAELEIKKDNSDVSKVFFQNKDNINELESKVSSAVKANNKPYTTKDKKHVIQVLTNKVINTTMLYRAQVKADDYPNNDDILDSIQRPLLQKEIDKALAKKSDELLAELIKQ